MYQYAGKCPECHGDKAVVKDNFIECGCGMRGDLSLVKFCERVPCFSFVKPENVFGAKGQLYSDKLGGVWILEGYASGCGRVVRGDFCSVCRHFMPTPADRPQRRGKVSARATEE